MRSSSWHCLISSLSSLSTTHGPLTCNYTSQLQKTSSDSSVCSVELQCTCPQLLHHGSLLPASCRTGGPPFPFLPVPSLSAQDGACSIPALAIEGREEEDHVIIENLEGDEL